MIDITEPEIISIEIRADGKVVWINDKNGCVLRMCKIKQLILIDNREKTNET